MAGTSYKWGNIKCETQFWCSLCPCKILSPREGLWLSQSLLTHAFLGGFGGDQGSGSQFGGWQREAVAMLLMVGPGSGQQHHITLSITLAAWPPFRSIPPGHPQTSIAVWAGALCWVGVPLWSTDIQAAGAGQGAGITQAF